MKTIAQLQGPAIVILCGSGADKDHANAIIEAAKGLGLDGCVRIASAHRTPAHAMSVLDDVNKRALTTPTVLISVAGRSNALSGFCDPQTGVPVIACPPPGNFADDIWSSLRMPAGVAPVVVLEPVNAALAAAKMLSLADPKIAKSVAAFQEQARAKVLQADEGTAKP